jgi:3-mercaptopyruvate sulfurtransferase SseA
MPEQDYANPKALVSTAWVAEHLNDPNIRLLEVDVDTGAYASGHIPGAASIPWAQAANEDGTFKSAEQLRQLYGSKGITPDKAVVTYCRIGERSSHTWFVLKELLGFPNVKNYDGSWTEYGSVVGVPIDNPAKAREPAAV